MVSMAWKALFLLALTLASATAWADKTDIVYLKNGDRVTGEIKSLDRGQLELSTDHMGTVLIAWEDIQEIISATGQTVELTSGQRHYGPLTKPEDQNMVVVNTDQGPVNVSVNDIMLMYPVEKGFWQRLNLNASLGFSWDKGSDVGKYDLGVNAELRDPEYIMRASFVTELTTQSERDSTSRTNFDIQKLNFRRNKRYQAIIGSAENNDELGIDFRGLAGLAYGWTPLRSQRNLFAIGGGLAVNYEVSNDGQSTTNLEAVGVINYDYFKRSNPERSLNTRLMVFPSITDAGRWRVNYDLDFNWELVSDFFWKMTIYARYDNEPLSAEASESDYGITNSLAYKFF